MFRLLTLSRIYASQQNTPRIVAWDGDRCVHRILREHTVKYVHGYCTRNPRAYPAIHQELTKDTLIRDWLNVLYGNKQPTARDARALQSGHTLRTEESNYGHFMMESPFQTMAEQQEFCRVSMNRRRILKFASLWEQGPCILASAGK
jgi:hypothetical protein